MKLLLTVAYVGTAYCGYQVQPNGVTVQEALNTAAKALFGVDCDIVGCSRTDSGVHARAFQATVCEKGKSGLSTTLPPSRVPRAMNAFLPKDISVLAARAVEDSFHARYDVHSKEYEYLLLNTRERDPFLADRVWHYPTPLDENALCLMNRAAEAFVGTRDFSALRDGGADAEENAVRTVYSASVTRRGDLISFRVCADGFLYHMVRIMMGTLIAVAKGKIPADEIEARLLTLDRTKMGETAPAAGLYLDRVLYREP